MASPPVPSFTKWDFVIATQTVLLKLKGREGERNLVAMAGGGEGDTKNLPYQKLGGLCC